MHRLFFAVPLPADVRHRLRRFADGLPFDGIRWVAEDLLHITMRFIGDVEPSDISAIAESVRPELGGTAPFSVTLDHFGVFPPRTDKPPRVLWVGVSEGAEDLAEVAACVERGLARWGLQPENRPFTPHVTLGRVRRGGPAPRSIDPSLHEFPQCPVEVESVVLYESRLAGAGSSQRPAGSGHEYLQQARMNFHAGS